MQEIIAKLEEELTVIKEQTAKEIAEINAYLARAGAKTKLRPRLKQNGKYSSFSIVWGRMIHFNFHTRQARAKHIKKGRSYQVPRSRLLAHCRDCQSWEPEYIWEKEQGLAMVREKVDLLSKSLLALKQYVKKQDYQLTSEDEL